MARCLSRKGVFSGLNLLTRLVDCTGGSIVWIGVFSTSSGSCAGVFEGVKSVPLRLAEPLIPVFFGEADRGGGRDFRRDLRVERTCVGSRPLPIQITLAQLSFAPTRGIDIMVSIVKHVAAKQVALPDILSMPSISSETSIVVLEGSKLPIIPLTPFALIGDGFRGEEKRPVNSSIPCSSRFFSERWSPVRL